MTSLKASVTRRYVKSIGLVVLIAAVFAISGPSAQTQPDSSRPGRSDADIPLAQQADCLAFGDARAVRAFNGGPPRAIGTEPGRSIRHPRPVDALAGPEPAARSYLSLCGSLFGLPERGELQLKRQEAATRLADDGRLSRRSIVRFQQAQNGVPVIGGELIVHLDDAQNILFVGGKAMSKPLADVTPTVVPAAAAAAALAAVAKAHNISADALIASTPELWIYEPRLIGPDSNPSVLVWRLEVTPRAPEAIR